jgi:methionyl-tRNA synthetase
VRSYFQRSLVIFLGLLLAVPMSLTQDAGQPQGFPTRQQQQIPGQPQPPSPEEEQRAKIERDMAKKANQVRQAQLKRDTDKLLQLSTELKQYVDKTNENVLSFEVVKKAEEIEKLAHSVREKMKGS